MGKKILYPGSDEIEARKRKFAAEHLEEEAKIRGQYGAPEDRKHERERLHQEWEKIQHDQKSGLTEDQVWRNHVVRMYKMSNSMNDAGKCQRRAAHLEACGLKSAAQMFKQRAAALQSNSKKGSSGGVVKALEQFNQGSLNSVWGEPNAEILPPQGGPAAQKPAVKNGKKGKKAMKKSLFKALDLSRFVVRVEKEGELQHHAYIRREGTPGNYRYFYEKKSGESTPFHQMSKEDREKVKEHAWNIANELMSYDSKVDGFQSAQKHLGHSKGHLSEAEKHVSGGDHAKASASHVLAARSLIEASVGLKDSLGGADEDKAYDIYNSSKKGGLSPEKVVQNHKTLTDMHQKLHDTIQAW